MKSRRKVTARRKEESHRSRSPPNSITAYDADESDSDELPSGYHQVSIQVISYRLLIIKFYFPHY